MFRGLRALFARKPKSAPRRKSPSPKRRTPTPKRSVRRTSPSVKRSGALGSNWYGGRSYISSMGPLMRTVKAVR